MVYGIITEVSRLKRFIVPAILLLCFFSFSGAAVAKLSVADPDQMLQAADLIIVGTILSRDYTENERKVSIKIDSVLKGQTDLEVIKLQRKLDDAAMYGWLSFAFPEQGSRVMVLLTENEINENYGLFLDLNNVAVVINNQEVKLYKGGTINYAHPELYDEKFSEFFRENYKPLETSAKQEREKIKAEQGFLTQIQLMTLFIALLVLGGSIIYFSKVRRVRK